MSKDLSKKTRRSFSTTNYLDNCFLYDKSDEKLYSCATKLLNKHVNKWEVYMQDRKLLAKRNEGDMTATENAKTALQICTTNLKSNIKMQKLRRNYY